MIFGYGGPTGRSMFLIEGTTTMTSQETVDAQRLQEKEDLVLLDGHRFVSEWPETLALSLLADPTPWWGSWPGDPTDEPNRGSDFAQLANCVYGYCRYQTRGDLVKFFGLQETEATTFTDVCATSSTQKLLDALYFMFCQERFCYGSIRNREKRMRQALQEVVQRVHSAYPPHFLAVTRLISWLMDGKTRLGVLTPYASRAGYLSCRFAADPAFSAIQPFFEEANQLTANGLTWQKAYEKVMACGLFLLREDGVKGVLNELRIQDGDASFCLSQELVVWNEQARNRVRIGPSSRP